MKVGFGNGLSDRIPAVWAEPGKVLTQFRLHILFSLAVCAGALKTNETGRVPRAVRCRREREGPLRKPQEEEGQQRCLQEPRCGSRCCSRARSPCPAPPARLSPLSTSRQRNGPAGSGGNASDGITNLENTSCFGEKAAKSKAQLASVISAGSCLPCLPGARGSTFSMNPSEGRGTELRGARGFVFSRTQGACSAVFKMDQQPYIAS